MKKIIFSIIFVVSILLNVGLGGYWLLNQSAKPKDVTGVLTGDLEIGKFGDIKTLFTLPKGLTITNETPSGLGQAGLFEPNRFSITITANSHGFVDYSENAPRDSNGSYYSAEVKQNRSNEAEVAKINEAARYSQDNERDSH